MENDTGFRATSNTFSGRPTWSVRGIWVSLLRNLTPPSRISNTTNYMEYRHTTRQGGTNNLLVVGRRWGLTLINSVPGAWVSFSLCHLKYHYGGLSLTTNCPRSFSGRSSRVSARGLYSCRRVIRNEMKATYPLVVGKKEALRYSHTMWTLDSFRGA